MIELDQLSERHPGDRIKSTTVLLMKELFGVLIGKRLDHVNAGMIARGIFRPSVNIRTNQWFNSICMRRVE